MGIPHTRASASEVDWLGCSSGYGAQPVGLSWLPGGTLNAAPATDGHLALPQLMTSRVCHKTWKNTTSLWQFNIEYHVWSWILPNKCFFAQFDFESFRWTDGHLAFRQLKILCSHKDINFGLISKKGKCILYICFLLSICDTIFKIKYSVALKMKLCGVKLANVLLYRYYYIYIV